MYKNFIKRFIDFIVAFLGLLVLSPIFLFVTIGLFFANNGKPFFFQLRPGKEEKIFKIIKFKTMNDKMDDKGNLLSDTKRLTTIGSFVRKASLDEIPQLINVILGDMSLIGPRPLLVSYLPYYTNEERLRHTVLPGITGLAQVNGRNTVKWDDRLRYDVEYVKNISFRNDVLIIINSINVVLFSKGLSVDPSILMKDLNDERRNRD
ncbi:lipopolysaccharide/colanic/teichoic acid biosynthesis glycosyltransferase [Flavobacterium tiangeerense]|uniref:Lipopolysaccharide/colanic/teichoic acid biosynthesis glycosyltransferase n=1 Tax=Flavobacterium tiangeerense TaxID=459471 RepID=A0ABY3FJJ4_9FLAO|nr:sugar transferase [Flavobacterium tiangeerense]TWH99157.1 lipopolysaccharide/colanic/teichoic acid biosynthesis glycosyltransferase [Flavobacterium tiangeerense]